MPLIRLETHVAAPPERCFLLSLSIDLHQASTQKTNERAVDGVTHGLIGPGETVTFRGRHFGLMLTHQSVITAYDRPHQFQDRMLRGAFKSFEHDHFFDATAYGTCMRDELRFRAPLGPLGRIAERLVLKSYLTAFLQTRNRVIKQMAESPDEAWRAYT